MAEIDDRTERRPLSGAIERLRRRVADLRSSYGDVPAVNGVGR